MVTFATPPKYLRCYFRRTSRLQRLDFEKQRKSVSRVFPPAQLTTYAIVRSLCFVDAIGCLAHVQCKTAILRHLWDIGDKSCLAPARASLVHPNGDESWSFVVS